MVVSCQLARFPNLASEVEKGNAGVGSPARLQTVLTESGYPI